MKWTKNNKNKERPSVDAKWLGNLLLKRRSGCIVTVLQTEPTKVKEPQCNANTKIIANYAQKKSLPMIVACNAIADHIRFWSNPMPWSLNATWSFPIVGNSCRVATTTIKRTNMMKRISPRMMANKIMKKGMALGS